MPGEAFRIKRNSLFVLLSQLIRLFTNALLFVGVARFYGPIGFGQFTAAHTLSTIFLLLSEYGFDTLLVTEIAHDRERAPQIVGTYFSVKVILAVVSTLLMIVFVGFEPVSG